MAVDATSNSAVIAGRSQTSTRPVFSCRVSSASNLGHSEAGAWEAGGDTGPAARRCSHARCRHPEPHQRGTRPRAATTTSPPHHPHATTSGRQGASPRMPPSIPGTSHLPCQRLPRNRHTPLALRCQPSAVETSVRNRKGCRWTSNRVRAAADRCTGPSGAAGPVGAPKPAAAPPTRNVGPPLPGPSPSGSCSGKPPANPAPPSA